MTFRGSSLRTPPDPNAPLKHVIDEYRHQAQLVTCVCGWHGSSAGVLGDPSPWALHVRQYRTPRR